MPYYAVHSLERLKLVSTTMEVPSVLHEFPTRDRRDAWVARGNAALRGSRRAIGAREARALVAEREGGGDRCASAVRHSFIRPAVRARKG